MWICKIEKPLYTTIETLGNVYVFIITLLLVLQTRYSRFLLLVIYYRRGKCGTCVILRSPARFGPLRPAGVPQGFRLLSESMQATLLRVNKWVDSFTCRFSWWLFAFCSVHGGKF